MRMNEEQRALAQEHMFIVGLRMKRRMAYIPQGEWADYYQIGCVGLCKAAAAYRPGGCTFNTYASRCIDNEIFMALRRERVRREERRAASLDARESKDKMTLGELIEDRENVESLLSVREIRRAISAMDEKERKVLTLRAQGYGQEAIGRAAGVSQSYVSRILKKTYRALSACASA